MLLEAMRTAGLTGSVQSGVGNSRMFWESRLDFDSKTGIFSVDMGNLQMDNADMEYWCDWFAGKAMDLLVESSEIVEAHELDFSGNQLTGVGVRRLIDTLGECGIPTQVLNLQKNRIECEQSLLQFIADCQGGLHELHLGHNLLGTEAAAALLSAAFRTSDAQGDPAYPGSNNTSLLLSLEHNSLDYLEVVQRAERDFAKLDQPGCGLSIQNEVNDGVAVMCGVAVHSPDLCHQTGGLFTGTSLVERGQDEDAREQAPSAINIKATQKVTAAVVASLLAEDQSAEDCPEVTAQMIASLFAEPEPSEGSTCSTNGGGTTEAERLRSRSGTPPPPCLRAPRSCGTPPPPGLAAPRGLSSSWTAPWGLDKDTPACAGDSGAEQLRAAALEFQPGGAEHFSEETYDGRECSFVRNAMAVLDYANAEYVSENGQYDEDLYEEWQRMPDDQAWSF